MKDALTVNWFDAAAVTMLIIGVIVGRKRGMSSELLSVIQWLAIVFLGAMACGPVGKWLAELSGFSPVTTYITAYLLAALVIKIVFWMIKRMAGEKLVGSDVFGNLEYYLGMIAGGVHFTCITIFALALLHAKPVNAEHLAAQI